MATKNKQQALSIFSEEEYEQVEQSEEENNIPDPSVKSIRDQFLEQNSNKDDLLKAKSKLPPIKSLCKAHQQPITRLCISNPCGAYQAGACDECIRQFHNHKIARYLRVSTFEEQMQACLYSKGLNNGYYQRKLRLVEHVREYLRKFAIKINDIFEQTSKNIEKMVGNKSFFQLLKNFPEEIAIIDRLKLKNYENVPNPILIEIYAKMQQFQREGESSKENEIFLQNVEFLKTNLLHIIDQTQHFIELPIFKEFYQPFPFRDFAVSSPIISICETIATASASNLSTLSDPKAQQSYANAKKCIEGKQIQQAIKQLNKCIVSNPRMSELYELKAGCLSNLRGNELTAINNFSVSQKLTPENINVTLTKCELLMRMKKLDEVENEIKAHIPPEKYNQRAFLILGNFHFIRQDFKKAVDCYDKAIAINNRNPDTFLLKGKALSRFSKFDEAVKMLKFASQLKPQLDQAFLEMGNIDLVQLDYSSAISNFQRAKLLNPKKKVYFDKLCLSYEKIGRENQAAQLRNSAIYKSAI